MPGNKKLLPLILLGLVAAAWLALSGQAAAQGAGAGLGLAPVSVDAGDAFTVTLVITSDVPTRGAQLDLLFDPTVVRLNSVAQGSFYSSWAQANGSGSTAYFPPAINNTAGTATALAIAILGGTTGAGPTGQGALATLQMTALANGVTPLVITNTIVVSDSQQSGALADVAVSDGGVYVGQPISGAVPALPALTALPAPQSALAQSGCMCSGPGVSYKNILQSCPCGSSNTICVDGWAMVPIAMDSATQFPLTNLGTGTTVCAPQLGSALAAGAAVRAVELNQFDVALEDGSFRLPGDLAATWIARDALCVIAAPAHHATNITLQNLADIYNGSPAALTWQSLGDPGGSATAVVPHAWQIGSDAREQFLAAAPSLRAKSEVATIAQVQSLRASSSASMFTAVQDDPAGIGYIPYFSYNELLQAAQQSGDTVPIDLLEVGGVACNRSDLLSHTYPLISDAYMLTQP